MLNLVKCGPVQTKTENVNTQYYAHRRGVLESRQEILHLHILPVTIVKFTPHSREHTVHPLPRSFVCFSEHFLRPYGLRVHTDQFVLHAHRLRQGILQGTGGH